MNKKIIKVKKPPRTIHITHLKRVSNRMDDLEVPKIKIIEPEEIKIQELEKTYQKEYEEIYQAALEEGKRLGFQMSQEQVPPQVHTLNTIITELSTQREKLLKDAEAIVVKLAYAIAQKIIRDQISTNSDLILNMVREAIKRVVDKDTILIKVNPSDWAVVKKHKATLSNGINHLEIVEDEQVGQGGCVIETNSGNIDARIETQLEEIERALLKGLQSV